MPNFFLMSFPVKISEGCAMKGSFHTPFMPEINDKELRERERKNLKIFLSLIKPHEYVKGMVFRTK